MPVKGDTLPMPLDFAAKFIELEGNITALTKHYGNSVQTIRDRWIPQLDIKQYELSDVPRGRPAEMLTERDLDPEHWQVRGMRVNEWEVTTTDEDGEPTTNLNRQTRLDIVPRHESIRAARPDGWKPPKPKKRNAGVTWTDLIHGDKQAPYQDARFHKALCGWAADIQPRKIIDDGDLPDFPSVSKYPKKASWNAGVNECIDASYRIWCDMRSSSPDSECVQIEGNHCKRLADKIARDFDEASSIRRADEDTPALSLPHLLRLDELGVEYVGNYPHNLYKLSDDTAVIHGDKVKSGSGATGLATLMQRGYNVFVGHIHRQSITEHTWHDIDGNPFTRFAVEVGAGCNIREGLGHTVNPDWQIGAATATFHKDGTMHPELITWDGKYLTWRGERWR